MCCDLHPHRVKLIEEGAARLGLNILRPMVQDATQYNPERGSFDRVLCDVVWFRLRDSPPQAGNSL